MEWLQLALVVGLLVVVGVLAAASRRPRGVSPDSYTDLDIDVGTVSESWLTEHRGDRTDRLSL